MEDIKRRPDFETIAAIATSHREAAVPLDPCRCAQPDRAARTRHAMTCRLLAPRGPPPCVLAPAYRSLLLQTVDGFITCSARATFNRVRLKKLYVSSSAIIYGQSIERGCMSPPALTFSTRFPAISYALVHTLLSYRSIFDWSGVNTLCSYALQGFVHEKYPSLVAYQCRGRTTSEG
jgi:hypothetical protein